MPTVTLRFTLPEEQPEFDAARLGSDAKACVWELDQYCRTTLKHGDPSSETRGHLERIRAMIAEYPELLG